MARRRGMPVGPATEMRLFDAISVCPQPFVDSLGSKPAAVTLFSRLAGGEI